MTTEVATEIDKILEKLQSDIPANINAPRNQKLAKRLEKEIESYFKALQDAFPHDELQGIYFSHVKESIESETGDILDPILGTLNATLKIKIAGHLTTIYLSGGAEMMEWAGVAFEGPPFEEAIKYAEKRCAELITKMDEETKRQVAKVISDGIKNKRGVPGLTTDIKRELGWMGRGRPSAIKGLTMQSRASMIARTETATALGAAFEDRGKELSIEAKEWICAGGDACEVCLDNQDAGVIPFSDAFPSGHMTPPAHPRCRCCVAPARFKR